MKKQLFIGDISKMAEQKIPAIIPPQQCQIKKKKFMETVPRTDAKLQET